MGILMLIPIAIIIWEVLSFYVIMGWSAVIPTLIIFVVIFTLKKIFGSRNFALKDGVKTN